MASEHARPNRNRRSATTNGTSGPTSGRPSHLTGNQSDGGVSWDFDAVSSLPLELDLNNTAFPTPAEPLWEQLIIYDVGDIVYFGRNVSYLFFCKGLF